MNRMAKYVFQERGLAALQSGGGQLSVTNNHFFILKEVLQ